jgi:hydrogenase maturation protease
MGQALRLGIERLSAWGCEPVRRAQPLPEDDTLTGAMLTLNRYESERPNAELACRIGDARFIPASA